MKEFFNTIGRVLPVTSDCYTGRLALPNGTPITVIHIGEKQPAVAAGTGAEPGTVFKLSIGSRKSAAEYFQHNPPTAIEIENSIVAVEDAVVNARTIIAGGSAFFTSDEAIHKIALIAGVPDRAELTLTRDAMERTFERLIALMLGRPASQEGIPTNFAFAATLLILREFMHYMQFLSITVMHDIHQE
jgi:hypothetical protein